MLKKLALAATLALGAVPALAADYSPAQHAADGGARQKVEKAEPAPSHDCPCQARR